MGTKNICKYWVSLPILPSLANKGQALVEFTLIFILMLIVAWVPVDFGLAMYSSQIALNASRDGARIAAADPTLAADQQCTMPCAGATGILDRVADRMRGAFLKGATIRIERVAGGTCNEQVRATVSGTYRFFFYRLLGWFGLGTANNPTIARVSEMRWEHQC